MINQATIQKVVEFHGHMCAGLALGIRAAEVGLAEVGPHAADEEVVAVVETDMCAVDAIQFLTGCTFGKGNLLHLDYGKNAYTFIRRSDGKAVRVSTRADALSASDPERLSLRVLDMPLEQLYDVREVTVEAPRPARILASVTCETCDEATMETRIRRLDGRALCLPCFEDALAGTVRVPSPGV